MILFHIFSLFLGMITMPEAPTPSPAEWTRKILIGFNDLEMVYMEIKRSAPGSYYSYTDSSFVISRNPENSQKIQRQILRATLHEDLTANGDWGQRELYTETLDMNEYLTERKLHYAFASSRPWIGSLKFEEYGLVLQYKDIGRLLLSREKIADQSMEFLEMMEYEKPRIIAKFDSRDYLFLTVQLGQDNMDSDFKQFIIAVAMSELSDAEQTFRDLNRR